MLKNIKDKKQQQKELNNSNRVVFYGLSSPGRFVRNILTSVSVKALQEADMKGKTGYALFCNARN